jgi:hypothetical protein
MFFRKYALLFSAIVFLLLSCKKQDAVNDNYTDPPEQITTLSTQVSSAGREFIEIKWNKVEDSYFKNITYAAYLDGKKIVDKLTSTTYSFINLNPGQKYTIKVVATTNEGNQVEQTLEGSTLAALTETEQIFYQKYSIHDYSMLIGPTGLYKLADGGHLLVKELAHPKDFTHEHYKIVVFKNDKYGHMLWYRLLSFTKYGLPVDEAVFNITTVKGDQDAILFAGNYAVKIAVNNGEVLMEKSYSDILPEQLFQTINNASTQEIIAGTNYANLLSISPEDLHVLWHQGSQAQSGSLGSIQLDSKKNIYGIFNGRLDQHTPIRVNKYDSKGKYIKTFAFDGVLEGEMNYGFSTTALLIDAQDNLYLFGNNSDYPYMRFFKFKTDGTLIKKNEQSEKFPIKDAYFNRKGEIVTVGQIDVSGLITYGGIYIFDKEMNIKSKHIWSDLPPHILSGITSNDDGTYNLFLGLMPLNSQYDGFIFIKTAVDGKV